jgi:AraC-like DNA-binding protein
VQHCGYGDQSAFTRRFRKVSGLTPGQYRRLHGWVSRRVQATTGSDTRDS